MSLAELVDRLRRLRGVIEPDITSEAAAAIEALARPPAVLPADLTVLLQEARGHCYTGSSAIIAKLVAAIEALARPPVLPADLAELVARLRHGDELVRHGDELNDEAAAAIEALARERQEQDLLDDLFDEAKLQAEGMEALVRERDACSRAANAWKAERDIEKERAETAEREAAALRRVLEMICAEATEAKGQAFHLTAEQWTQVYAALSAPTGGTSDG